MSKSWLNIWIWWCAEKRKKKEEEEEEKQRRGEKRKRKSNRKPRQSYNANTPGKTWTFERPCGSEQTVNFVSGIVLKQEKPLKRCYKRKGYQTKSIMKYWKIWTIWAKGLRRPQPTPTRTAKRKMPGLFHPPFQIN